MNKRTRIKQTLNKTNPKLAREWHPTKNAPLRPKDVTHGSEKKVWWMCKKGHEWESLISSRSRGHGCPYCTGRMAGHDNCLQSVNPELAEEWHPTRNASLTPMSITSGSHKEVWWICTEGHEWKAAVYSRNIGNGCPYCAGRKVDNRNCFQAVNPDLAREWHPKRNATLTPRDVTAGCNEKAWWMCKKGHEWEAAINHRNRGSGCPYCAGQKVSKDNCLQAINPRLAREWHPTMNSPLTPRDVTACTHKKVWWMCKRGHEWEASISNRNKGRGCAFCSGRRANRENCLRAVNPRLSMQWHSSNNMPLTPDDITPGSSKVVWWVCRKGHEWKSNIYNRSRGNGCPYCAGQKPTKENCLQTVSPRVTREWHPIKNAPLTPRDVTRLSRREIWWRCDKGHEWQETVINRFKGFGCPVCILREKYPQKANFIHPIVRKIK